MKAEIIGWIATGALASSYLFKNVETLRRAQALGACLWIA